MNLGLGCSSVVESLPSKSETLGSALVSREKEREGKKGGGEKRKKINILSQKFP
jgi:hypothetical protein